ncbi:hypothetical protein [Planomonospora sp. ID82291]|uniref:hypothetical protein n=1 Tax=Planomonospora sp. ID82291 TaxID=2738136 RepID=UPI001E4730BE|nr:hypothetical protein [Planomonospora sp. ID82291]
MAMLVPALLAGGLMMAEVTGYDLVVSGTAVDVQAGEASGGAAPIAAGSPGSSGTSRVPVATRAAGGESAGEGGAVDDAPSDGTANGGATTGRTVTRGAVTESELVGNRMTEPSFVPPPLRPYRVYDGWMPPETVSLVYLRPAGPSEEAGRAAEAAEGRRKRRGSGGGGEKPPEKAHGPGTGRAQGPAESTDGEAPDRAPAPSPTPSPTPSSEESADAEAECSQEWRDTWLWEICLDGNRQKV